MGVAITSRNKLAVERVEVFLTDGREEGEAEPRLVKEYFFVLGVCSYCTSTQAMSFFRTLQCSGEELEGKFKVSMQFFWGVTQSNVFVKFRDTSFFVATWTVTPTNQVNGFVKGVNFICTFRSTSKAPFKIFSCVGAEDQSRVQNS